MTVAEVVVAFRRWLHLPDARPLLAVLGTVAANRLEGDSIWLLLVGPPGGGKSEVHHDRFDHPRLARRARACHARRAARPSRG
jgi:hypothetical protein